MLLKRRGKLGLVKRVSSYAEAYEKAREMSSDKFQVIFHFF